MTLEELSRELHHQYSHDAAQEALLALLARPVPPDDPVHFCHRVASRFDRRRFSRTRGERRFEPLSPTLALGASQLKRAEMRQTLERCSRTQIEQALGLHESEPGDPPPQRSKRKQWSDWLRRRRLKRERK